MTTSDQLLPISEAAKILDVSIDTLRRWDKSGIIRAKRSPQGHRLFNVAEINRVIAKQQSRSQGHGERHYSIHKDAQPNGLNSIDLFAGAGGTALGLSNAGFDHLLLSELDRHAAATLRKNRPEWNVAEGDVAELDFSEFRGQVDLVEGGFPCQAFSYAGHSRGFEDTRGTLFFQFARAVSETMPKVFIGENVKGLLRHDRGRTLETMMRSLAQIEDEQGVGYTFGYRIIRSQYHDVPQKRERLIIMGVREDVGTELFFPKEREYIVSLWDAIGDKPSSPGATYPESKRRVLAQVPAGGYWRDLPVEEQKKYLGGSFHLSGGKTGMARRLSWDEPSLTLTCAPAQKQTERCHPEETRPLNVREYARIQTFPDHWDFEGGLGASYKQIGNAVPVNVGYFLGKCAETMIDPSKAEIFSDFVEPAHSDEYVSRRFRK
ncbi:DNA (cytosine-5-)-methyltransferase [Corynebacterium pseudopelargi]|uniref:Cytosine-specific methyltransferase n=1 Tax=Corynebacterium pseudopelargi TaxID=2080757 RepID=A0A3G6IVB8_9CORY|nr:DNA (cytosine-5-)-methyltransferase [Corynebacterium pseudopelargi]AZA09523.1 Modification methylase HhaI [Corynebacterium pseudopelargi]